MNREPWNRTAAERRLVKYRETAAANAAKHPGMARAYPESDDAWRENIAPTTALAVARAARAFDYTRARQAGNWESLDSLRERRGSSLDRAYYADKWPQGWRLIGRADEVSEREHSRRVEHSGWFTDDFQKGTLSGYVLQLPARDGRPCYIAGTAHSEWSGVTLYPLQVTDEKLDAATWADRIAEIEAEKERDYRAASSARVAFDEKAEELAAVRTERRGLQRELRRARLDAKEHGLKTAPTLCAVIREKISALVERAEELAKERRELDATFSGQPGWQN